MTDVLKERAAAGILEKQAIADRTPVGRWGTPDEIAKAALYLASEDASFVTGSTLVVDGGLSIRGDAGEDLDSAPELDFVNVKACACCNAALQSCAWKIAPT